MSRSWRWPTIRNRGGFFYPDCGRDLDKILPQDNVGVDIGQDWRFGHSPGPVEVLTRGVPWSLTGHVRDVAQVQLPGDFPPGCPGRSQRMMSGRGVSLVQLVRAFLWMMPVCPSKALGMAKMVRVQGGQARRRLFSGQIWFLPPVQVLLERQGSGCDERPRPVPVPGREGPAQGGPGGPSTRPGHSGRRRGAAPGPRAMKCSRASSDLTTGEELQALAEAGQGRGGAPVQAEGFVPRQGERFHGIEKVCAAFGLHGPGARVFSGGRPKETSLAPG